MAIPLKKTAEDFITRAEISSQDFYKLIEEQIKDAPELEELRMILKNVPLDEIVLSERRKEREIWS